MRSDVFPDPVGPRMRLIAPRLNLSSSRIFNTNPRRGVVDASSSVLVHAKVASRMPMSEGSSSETDCDSVQLDTSVYWSRSSAYGFMSFKRPLEHRTDETTS